MTETHLAEVFPAGEYLADELEERVWTHADFAEIIDRPAQFVSDIVNGKKEITRTSAAQFAAALGTSPELWLNLQDSYLLWKQSQDNDLSTQLGEVERRARLREVADISNLVKHGFVRKSSLDAQENDIRALLGPNALGGEPDIRFAARRSNETESTTVTQRSWAACVRATARNMSVPQYDPGAFKALAASLAGRLQEPRDLGEFQDLFAETGVKLIYVASFSRGKLDGCAFIDDDTPVIGLSGRGKRLDKIFFTLMHEASHVLLDHVGGVDDILAEDLGSTDASITSSQQEAEADALAAELILPGGLSTVPDRIDRNWVRVQAEKHGVAPIIIIGRLQKTGSLGWDSTLSRGAPSALAGLELWSSSAAEARTAP